MTAKAIRTYPTVSTLRLRNSGQPCPSMFSRPSPSLARIWTPSTNWAYTTVVNGLPTYCMIHVEGIMLQQPHGSNVRGATLDLQRTHFIRRALRLGNHPRPNQFRGVQFLLAHMVRPARLNLAQDANFPTTLGTPEKISFFACEGCATERRPDLRHSLIARPPPLPKLQRRCKSIPE